MSGKVIAVIALLASMHGRIAAQPAGPSMADSKLHRYYLDLDQDSYGDKSKSYLLSSPYPPVHWLVPWGNDPDDSNSTKVPVPAPKGGRIAALDLLAPAQDGQVRQDLALELGVDTVSLHFPWNQLESKPGVYDGPALQLIQQAGRLAREGFSISLTVSVITGGRMSVPSDLSGAGALRLTSPDVQTRYEMMLGFLRSELPGAEIKMLDIGEEIDILAAVRGDSAFWDDLDGFLRQASLSAKRVFGGDIAVGINARYSALLSDIFRSRLVALNRHADFVSVSYLPNLHYVAADPESVRASIDALASIYAGKRLRFQKAAMSSSVLTFSSETKQTQFLHAFFDAWDAHADQIDYVCFGPLFDFSARQSNLIAADLEATSSLQTIAGIYFGAAGLRTFPGKGTAKAGYHTLREKLFERGWWREQDRKSRSFYMGFTTFPFDIPLYDEIGVPVDPGREAEIEHWTDAVFEKDTDLVGIHLDLGVPWGEALADGFDSAELPYSNAVKQEWRFQKARLLPRKKRLVAINPMGVPRETLADYWGYGEGYTRSQDGKFRRIPDGKFLDAPQRLPPGEWNTYRFDHPNVKKAFVNYARRAIQYFEADYLVVGIEVDAAWVTDPSVWPAYVDLHKHVYSELKKYTSIPVIVTFSATSFMADEYLHLVTDRTDGGGYTFKDAQRLPGGRSGVIDLLTELLPYTDIIGLSLYPHFGKYFANRFPPSTIETLFETISAAGGADKPVAITEGGYSADAFQVLAYSYLASAEKQDRYHKALFYELAKASNPVEFVCHWAVRDFDLYWNRIYEADPTSQFASFYQFFRDLGVYDGDGNPRPALNTWRKELALPVVRNAATP